MQWKCLNCETVNQVSGETCEVCGSVKTLLTNEIVWADDISLEFICSWLRSGNYQCDIYGDLIQIQTHNGKYFASFEPDKELIEFQRLEILDADDDGKALILTMLNYFNFFSMTIGDPLDINTPTIITKHQIYLGGGIPSQSILTTFQKCVGRFDSVAE